MGDIFELTDQSMVYLLEQIALQLLSETGLIATDVSLDIASMLAPITLGASIEYPWRALSSSLAEGWDTCLALAVQHEFQWRVIKNSNVERFRVDWSQSPKPLVISNNCFDTFVVPDVDFYQTSARPKHYRDALFYQSLLVKSQDAFAGIPVNQSYITVESHTTHTVDQIYRFLSGSLLTKFALGYLPHSNSREQIQFDEQENKVWQGFDEMFYPKIFSETKKDLPQMKQGSIFIPRLSFGFQARVVPNLSLFFLCTFEGSVKGSLTTSCLVAAPDPSSSQSLDLLRNIDLSS